MHQPDNHFHTMDHSQGRPWQEGFGGRSLPLWVSSGSSRSVKSRSTVLHGFYVVIVFFFLCVVWCVILFANAVYLFFKRFNIQIIGYLFNTRIHACQFGSKFGKHNNSVVWVEKNVKIYDQKHSRQVNLWNVYTWIGTAFPTDWSTRPILYIYILVVHTCDWHVMVLYPKSTYLPDVDIVIQK